MNEIGREIDHTLSVRETANEGQQMAPKVKALVAQYDDNLSVTHRTHAVGEKN